MRAEYFLFVHHTTSISTKLSAWCFEHFGDISRSLLFNPSHTLMSPGWEGRDTCLWIYTLWIHSLSTLENTDDESRILFVCSPHYKQLVNLSHNDESWEGQNTCMWVYTLWIHSLGTLEDTDESKIFFVRSPHCKHFGKAQHLVLCWATWWHQISRSLLVNPSHTDEFWEGRNTCLWIYI